MANSRVPASREGGAPCEPHLLQHSRGPAGTKPRGRALAPYERAGAPIRTRGRVDALQRRPSRKERIILAELSIILALALISGIFAGTEIAVIALRG
jgi:hypothetical protein